MLRKMTEEKILKKIIKIVKRSIGVKKVPEENLIELLGISSLKVFEMYFKFEQKFKICFEENEIKMENLNNLHNLAKLILTKI